MLNVRLPLSDQARALAVKVFVACYVVLIVPMICLNLAFYRLGSLAPDPATGRTFPVDEHGILYVLPWEGELAQLLFWVACFTLALIVILNPYHGRLFLLREE